ncbi:O-antigen ligase family protein [Siccirubricoccus sp. KC 17139]|uniref:O-antigen ligase family protein n=1 Tax=Siccirubricoccus soli TaxID=2899147 RepID=A0ABT1D4S0_9PROT|nr:O-antigen ligase family protein [Siccirubricoccus soli]MCO6416911.1 O-antigen ligase family protein [Siccirubricoccus soli]MCP2683046.1 O-antigen ligase family protein [Siccirubricoccus soli]
MTGEDAGAGRAGASRPGAVKGGLRRRAAAPADALGVALLVAPLAGVLQSKALAPIALCGLLGVVVLHRLRRGAWPWPGGAATAAALGLFGWALVTALWAPVAGLAAFTAVQIGAFVALGAAAARAVAEEEEGARQRLLRSASIGLALGIAAAGLDYATGHAIRGFVRGLREPPDTLMFGLKPAASAMGLWLPLLAVAPLPRWLRVAGLLAGAAVLAWLPGESAKIAVAVGALAGALAWLAPRRGPRLVGAGLALVLLLTPYVLGPVLARGIPAAGWPPSAAHRLLIWDFVGTRIAEKPLFGWGMEASRNIPGHRDPAPPEVLARFGLTTPHAATWIHQAERLPLHPHNGALQLRLELGIPGVLLAALLAWWLGVAAARSAAPAVATAMLAAGSVTGMLSFGAWQEWWVGAELLALVAASGLGRRTGAPPP